MSATRRSRVASDRLVAALVVGGWVLAVALVDPRADVPLIDDWTYAASVERLLAGKGFAVVAWSSTFPAAQIVWGALFAALAGFSFTALRASTLVLAAAATFACWGLLRLLGAAREGAAVGALALAVYPVFFVLGFTFMTDVPALAAMLASLWALAGALASPSDTRTPRLALGVVLALVAFLVRPVALAVPAALLLTALVQRALPSRRAAAAAACVALAAMAASTVVAGRYWSPAAGGEGGLAYRLERLRWVFLVSPRVYAEALLSMLAHVGLAAAPALIATAPSPRRWPWRLALALVVAALAVSSVAPRAVSALHLGGTWSTQELGAARPLLVGELPYGALRWAVALAATAVGILCGACLVVRTARALRSGGALRTPAGTLVAAFGAVSLALCVGLWFFYDRYYLPLVPVALAIALVPPRAADAGSVAPAWRPRAAALACALLFALDVSGTRDMLAYARAVDDALARLVAGGVAWRDVDAGYVENGWHLYAHPENLPPATDVDRDVPHVTGAADQPYAIANSPRAGFEVRATVAVPTTWAAGDRLYVLARPATPAAGSGGGR